jgi:hypothetical protein
VTARLEWERRAGWAGAWRELAGHEDEHDPLGAAPQRGLVEKSAMFRKAHEELGLLDAAAEEAGLTDGRLRARVRAYELEKEWAPPNVEDDLTAARQAIDKARVDATVWAARADATPDLAEASQLREAAAESARAAETEAERIRGLEASDEARGAWYAHTAATRDFAHRSRAELRARGIDLDDTSDHVTAEEWLDAHNAAQLDDDRHRDVRPDDLADEVERDEKPIAEAEPATPRRVAPVDETAAAIAEAQAALREISARQAADAERAAQAAAGRAEEELHLDEVSSRTTGNDVAERIDEGQALEL